MRKPAAGFLLAGFAVLATPQSLVVLENAMPIVVGTGGMRTLLDAQEEVVNCPNF